jgi:hypothetical protein
MRQRVWLTVFLLTPVLMLGAVLLGIHFLRPEMKDARPVGAGAGSTGGANAIGEYLAHGSAKRRDIPTQNLVAPESLPQGFVLVATDKTGLAGPGSPIYVSSNLNNWSGADEAWRLTLGSDGKWRLPVKRPAGGTLMEFQFTRAGAQEAGADGKAITPRELPAMDLSRLSPGEAPEIEFFISAWADQRGQKTGGS